MAKQVAKQSAGNAEEAMRVARACAFKARPYFAPILMAARLVESDKLDTLACDQYLRIYYNPAFVLGHSRWEIAGVLVHEIQHWLRRHFKRAQAIHECNGQVWNIAGDCAINDDLLIPGDALKLPAEGCYPKNFGFPEDLIEEDYYARLLKKQPPQQGGGGGKGQGSPQNGPKSPQGGAGDCGSAADGQPREYELGAPTSKAVDGDGDEDCNGEDGEDLSGVAEIDGDLLRRKVAEEVRRSSVGRGTVPGSLRRWADIELAPPTIPWQRVLRTQIARAHEEVAAQDDYTFSRMSRRAAACPDVILPGFSQPIPRIALVIDTSGSMGEAEGQAVLSEVQGIVRGVDSGVRVITIDAAVYSDQKNVTSAKRITTGGGMGTDMRVGIEHLAADRRDRPDVIVVLTDGDTPWPASRPRGVHRVIACLVRKPYGEMPPAWIKTVMVGKNVEVSS